MAPTAQGSGQAQTAQPAQTAGSNKHNNKAEQGQVEVGAPGGATSLYG